MNTFYFRRSTLFRSPTILVSLVLAALGLGACGGSDGDTTKGGGAPPLSPTPPLTGCTKSEYEAIWESQSCPEGLLCIGEVHGTGVTNITVLTSGSRPDWSPDGQAIVFERNSRPGNGVSDVIRINVDGSGETWLAEGREPAWSPDGARIVFQGNDGITLMNNDGAGIVTLAAHDPNSFAATFSAPAWAPDGHRIVFAERSYALGIPAQLTIINSDGSDARHLAMTNTDRWETRDPAWSPDGGTIAFYLNEKLTTIDAAGGDARFILLGPQSPGSRPDWSPDGSSIAFSAPNGCLGLDVSAVGVQGGKPTILAAGAREPAWSPDGTRIAFASAVDAFPDVTEPASVYIREDFETFGARSRYVLYDDDSFEFQYSSLQRGVQSYDGNYRWENGQVFLSFANNGGMPWHATGTLDGIRLSVTYNFAAALSDFAPGVYILSEIYE